MSEIMKLSFEQAKWAVFGWSWDNIEVKFAVVVSVGSIFWWLYKVTQNTHLKSLIQKLNRLVFSDIMEHSLPEFYSADERVKQNLEKLIAESDEGKVNGTLPTLDLDPLLVSVPCRRQRPEGLIALDDMVLDMPLVHPCIAIRAERPVRAVHLELPADLARRGDAHRRKPDDIGHVEAEIRARHIDGAGERLAVERPLRMRRQPVHLQREALRH